MPTPEDHAREHIDQALEQAGWKVQDYKSAHLHAGRGVVLRNFPLVSGHGFADYLLSMNGMAAGIIETKNEGVTLIGVEVQAEKLKRVGLGKCIGCFQRAFSSEDLSHSKSFKSSGTIVMPSATTR